MRVSKDSGLNFPEVSSLTLNPLFFNAIISAVETKSEYSSPFGFVINTCLKVVVPVVDGFSAEAS